MPLSTYSHEFVCVSCLYLCRQKLEELVQLHSNASASEQSKLKVCNSEGGLSFHLGAGQFSIPIH